MQEPTEKQPLQEAILCVVAVYGSMETRRYYEMYKWAVMWPSAWTKHHVASHNESIQHNTANYKDWLQGIELFYHHSYCN